MQHVNACRSDQIRGMELCELENRKTRELARLMADEAFQADRQAGEKPISPVTAGRQASATAARSTACHAPTCISGCETPPSKPRATVLDTGTCVTATGANLRSWQPSAPTRYPFTLPPTSHATFHHPSLDASTRIPTRPLPPSWSCEGACAGSWRGMWVGVEVFKLMLKRNFELWLSNEWTVLFIDTWAQVHATQVPAPGTNSLSTHAVRRHAAHQPLPVRPPHHLEPRLSTALCHLLPGGAAHDCARCQYVCVRYQHASAYPNQTNTWL